jgi:para-nitrobenzyl esterase
MRPILILAAALTLAGGCAQAEPARLVIAQGRLAGIVEAGVESFKGIAYAAPPVGPLRWRLPQPAKPWRGERDASRFGASCMQPAPPRNLAPDSPAAKVSEDCLTLNVWAPVGTKRAPVMVWLHGGGNVDGSSADRFYDGASFARDGVVLVSLNYRLGAFGFLAHPGFDGTNFGLWDQVAALRWVKANIARFGGDPANVTLFGESAGGEDLLALMTAAPAKGLFARAIAESAGGGWGPEPTLADARASGARLVAGLIPAGGTIRDIPAEKLVGLGQQDFGPTVDGVLLNRPVIAAFAAGQAMKIPLIIGTNEQEGNLLADEGDPAQVWPDRLNAADLAALRAAYGPAVANDQAFAQMLFRDGYFAGPARWIAARTGGWLYRFDYIYSPLRTRRSGAQHGSEIPFVFDRWTRTDEDDRRVTAALHGAWVAFAKTGQASWQPFNSGGQWMVFDANSSARPAAGQAALDILERKLK